MIINGYTIEPKANLSGADLSGANLREADLSGADLSRANLSWADLRGADLSGADLSRANLSEANLSWANLSEANLSGANLSWANLSEANLSGANLSWADLSRANLSEANLSGANLSEAILSGATWKTGNPIKKAPFQITGLLWHVLILDKYMQIGCQIHSFEAWKMFNDREIVAMDGRDGLRFWQQHKTMLLSLCEKGQQSYED